MFKRLAAGSLLLLAAAMPASAEQMTWTLRSEHPNRVQVKFYSQDRNVIWPREGRAYGLNDYEAHRFSLDCRSGEKICYGAWVTGDDSEYWGVGRDDQYDCRGCCAICGESDPSRTLTD